MKPWTWCLQKEHTQPRHKINDGVGVDEEECDDVIARLDSVNLYGDHDDDDVHDILDRIPSLIQEIKKDDSRFFVDVEDDPLLLKNLDPYLSGNNVDIKNLFEDTGEAVYDGTRIYHIDANVENPLLCPEIADEVIKNLRSMEMEKRATNDDMATQIDRRSRAKWVHWLIEAAQMLKCAPTTLHLAVNYFDRYSSGNPIEIKDLDMVVLTCLMIASKFDGVTSEFDFNAYVVLGGGFCEDELVGMEARILSYLEYDVMVPTAYSFLERFLGAAQCGRAEAAPLQGLESMAAGVAELSLSSTAVLGSFLPSMVAASSVFLAQYVLDPSQKPWNATLRHYTMYEASDLKDCVLALDGLWRRPLNECD